MMTKNAKLTESEAQSIADQYALEISLNATQSHRGTWFIPRLEKLLVYNNHPYGDASLRPREFDRIERRLREEFGINTLARGQGGETMGDSEQPYTMTLLLDCGEELSGEVYDVVRDEYAVTYHSIG